MVTYVWEELLRGRDNIAQTVLAAPSPGSVAASMATQVCLLGGFYGAIMGLSGGWRQSISSALKVPAMFMLTLAVCFPVLYVVNVLLGAALSMGQAVALILTSLAFNCVLLASCGPICAFFTLSGAGYHFTKLLHVSIFALCGLYGVSVLNAALRQTAAHATADSSRGTAVFFLWAIVFSFVGTQMAWRLRPFIGEPGLPFQPLRRSRAGLNFYSAVLLSIRGISETKISPVRTTDTLDETELSAT